MSPKPIVVTMVGVVLVMGGISLLWNSEGTTWTLYLWDRPEVVQELQRLMPDIRVEKNRHPGFEVETATDRKDFVKVVCAVNFLVDVNQPVTDEVMSKPFEILMETMRVAEAENLGMDPNSAWPEIVLERDRETQLSILLGREFVKPLDRTGSAVCWAYQWYKKERYQSSDFDILRSDIKGYLRHTAGREVLNASLVIDCLQSPRLAQKLEDLPGIRVGANPGMVAVSATSYDQEELDRIMERVAVVVWRFKIGKPIDGLDNPLELLCEHARELAAGKLGIDSGSSWGAVLTELQVHRESGESDDVFVPTWMPEGAQKIVDNALKTYFWNQQNGEELLAML